ncbi:MBL fold metallo-hydrolase [Bacillus sp. T33-2]|uniref:MBL fold metallo-hydrolase n=1 Tax=Bacillus sp. T33-2 TaxID=2054168 RepID=UPI0015E14759|nr:MBL fold metallo-hydrolase [Bacillus sp. T33-2]
MQNKTRTNLVQQIDGCNVQKNSLLITHMGQEGVAIKGESGRVLYFDLYLSDYVKEVDPESCPRNFPPPVLPAEISNANYYFITHHHLDHLDPVTVKEVSKASPKCIFVIPKAHVSILKNLGINDSRIFPVNAGKVYIIDGIKFHVLACKHEEFETDSDGNHFYVGYIVYLDGICFYHAGDTLVYSELINEVKSHQIDAAYIPINGRDYFRNEIDLLGNMNYREAVHFIQSIHVNVFIPCHYDLFEHNYENPSYLVDYLYQKDRTQKFKMMVPGEKYYYVR